MMDVQEGDKVVDDGCSGGDKVVDGGRSGG